MKKYDRDLSDYYEIVSDGKLYARQSGYVTFCKNLKNTNQVSAVENVVIVSDYEDCYIELAEHTVKETLVSSCFGLGMIGKQSIVLPVLT